MILYLAAAAVTILFSFGICSVYERRAYGTDIPRGFISAPRLKSTALMTGIFLILFLILALRINVGNDYAKYVEFMHLARFGAYVPTEPGFNFLAWAAFRIFGRENFLFCFAVIAFITVFCFLLAIDRLAVSFSLSFTMFMLLCYYFQSFSTVRYYLALSVTTLAIWRLFKNDIPRFVLLVVFAAFFHKSALIVLLFYPVAKAGFRRFVYVGMAAVGLLGILFRSQVLKLMLVLYPTYQETSLAEGGEGSLFSIARCVLMLIFVFLCDRESFLSGKSDDGDAVVRRFYCHCNVMALVIYLFFSYLPVVSRIGYYLTITQIFYVPMLIGRIRDDNRRTLVKVLTVLFCLGVFVLTMRGAHNDGFRILPYQTFVFHDMPPILSDTGY